MRKDYIDLKLPSIMGMGPWPAVEKVLAKTGPEEKLGVVVLEGGRPRVIEYSDLSAEEAERRDERGELVYWAGSIAIHAFSLEFLERICRGQVPIFSVSFLDAGFQEDPLPRGSKLLSCEIW